jgi:thiamine pyrophosphokinase
MNAVIIANGQFDANARLRELWQSADLRIAADGGARHAREDLGLASQVAVGDFDSLDEATDRWLEENRVERIRYPRAKDNTDLELAVDLAIARHATHITILGAFGGRIDQTLANILLAARGAEIVLADLDSDVWLATNETQIAGEIGETVSLIPLSDVVEGIETQGLVFPLRHESLTRGSSRGISNELSASRAVVRFERGVMLVVHIHRTRE